MNPKPRPTATNPILLQILEYSKLSNGSDEGGTQSGALNLAPFSIATLASELADIVGGRATLCGAELLVTMQPALYRAWFTGDAFRLRQWCAARRTAAVPLPHHCRLLRWCAAHRWCAAPG